MDLPTERTALAAANNEQFSQELARTLVNPMQRRADIQEQLLLHLRRRVQLEGQFSSVMGYEAHVEEAEPTESLVTAKSLLEAYALQAQHLLRYCSLDDQMLVLDNASAKDQEAVRPFRQLQATCGLNEQLDSVVPFLPPEERFQAAQELTNMWCHGEQEKDQFARRGDCPA